MAVTCLDAGPVHVSFGNDENSHLFLWTHCWDFPVAEDTAIFAVRGGLVSAVEEFEHPGLPVLRE